MLLKPHRTEQSEPPARERVEGCLFSAMKALKVLWESFNAERKAMGICCPGCWNKCSASSRNGVFHSHDLNSDNSSFGIFRLASKSLVETFATSKSVFLVLAPPASRLGANLKFRRHSRAYLAPF